MKALISPFVLLLSILASLVLPGHADDSTFHIYAPNRGPETLLVVRATASEDGALALEALDPVDLGIPAGSIVAHPDEPLLYITENWSGGEGIQGAAVHLADDGGVAEFQLFPIANGYSYLGLDRAGRFLLGCNYRNGIVDVYELGEDGSPGPLVSSVTEGLGNAHSALPSPDNSFVYVPYVKDNNALHQYRFNADTGALTPLKTLDAAPPENTGPRHIAYHPELPMVYFSNEQQLGVSVWEKLDSGQLELRQMAGLTDVEAPEKGVSGSDIVITPNARFLFTGIRGPKHDFDHISRFAIEEDGTVRHLGLTEADAVPWGLALSPDGRHLLASGHRSGTLMAYRIEDNGDLTRVATLDWGKGVTDLIAR